MSMHAQGSEEADGISIKGSKTVVEALNSNYVEHGSIIKHLENKSQQLEAKAVQLAGAYVIFNGILYTQAEAEQPRLRWLTFSIWASVSVAFWAVFATTVSECLRMKLLQEVNFLEQDKLYRRIQSIQMATTTAANASIVVDDEHLITVLASVRFRRNAYAWLLTSALLFSSFFVSYALILS